MKTKIYKNKNTLGKYGAWEIAGLIKDAFDGNQSGTAGCCQIINQTFEAEYIEEACSTCGRLLKKSAGRFRMIDEVYCMNCYYRRNPDKKTKGICNSWE